MMLMMMMTKNIIKSIISGKNDHIVTFEKDCTRLKLETAEMITNIA